MIIIKYGMWAKVWRQSSEYINQSLITNCIAGFRPDIIWLLSNKSRSRSLMNNFLADAFKNLGFRPWLQSDQVLFHYLTSIHMTNQTHECRQNFLWRELARQDRFENWEHYRWTQVPSIISRYMVLQMKKFFEMRLTYNKWNLRSAGNQANQTWT